MIALTHKSKQYGWFALKLFVLGAAFFYGYQKLSQGAALSVPLAIERMGNQTMSWIPLFLVLAATNWFLEGSKWHLLACLAHPISFWKAQQQAVASLTVSLPTPSRLGEYGAKAFFFQKKFRKQIVWLTFLGNASQMFATLLFGVVGVFFLSEKLNTPISPQMLVGFLAIGAVLGVVAYTIRSQEIFIKGLSLLKLSRYIKNMPLQTKIGVIGFSILRYAVFSSLFYFLLHFFGAATTLEETLPYIFALYLCTSLLPVFVIWDVVVKGSIAVWLFGFLGISEIIVLATVGSMWILNFALPALVGSYFVLKFQPK